MGMLEDAIIAFHDLTKVKLKVFTVSIFFFRLRSYCTFFCKRVNARAEMRHTDPLECSDCKIFACGKQLADAK